MALWLERQGLPTHPGTISHHLRKFRFQRVKQLLLTGSNLAHDADAVLKQNPAPSLDTIVQIFQVIIMQLTVQGTTDPDLLKLADQLARTAIGFTSGRARTGLEQQRLSVQERRVTLLEKKAAQADATDNVLVDARLSDAERQQRIREIYGRV
jgi:hypothetical protein